MIKIPVSRYTACTIKGSQNVSVDGSSVTVDLLIGSFDKFGTAEIAYLYSFKQYGGFSHTDSKVNHLDGTSKNPEKKNSRGHSSCCFYLSICPESVPGYVVSLFPCTTEVNQRSGWKTSHICRQFMGMIHTQKVTAVGSRILREDVWRIKNKSFYE